MLDRRNLLRTSAAAASVGALPGAAAGQGRRTATVEIADGRIAGEDRGGGAIAFRGIPYAAPTGGRNRFLAPQPVARWAGVRPTLRNGNRCPQVDAADFRIPSASGWFDWYADPTSMGEDCCVLNVFTPGLDPRARRPVMVYIHGGGFRSGSGGGPALDGSHLAAAGDVVVVTLNHRLNVLGYVDLGLLDPDFADAGNAGQLDLVAALRWVRENIAVFGGDPGNVLLFGQSGGGSKITVLMAMPAARELFHRAINMSGPSGYGIGPAGDRAALTEEYFRQLDLKRGDVRTLQAMPVERLYAAYARAVAALGEDDFRPVVDGRHILHAPLSAKGLALSAHVPLIIGTTRTEATAWLGKDPRNRAATLAEVTTRVGRQFALSDAEARVVIAAYRADDPDGTPYDLMIAVASDVLFRTRLVAAADAKVASGGAPVHLYSFRRDVQAEGGAWGSPHACDIPFAFRTLDVARSMAGSGPAPARVAAHYSGAFTASAHGGDPTPPGGPPWMRYALGRRPTMLFDETCRVEDDPAGTSRRASLPLIAQPPYRIHAGPLMRRPT